MDTLHGRQCWGEDLLGPPEHSEQQDRRQKESPDGHQNRSPCAGHLTNLTLRHPRIQAPAGATQLTEPDSLHLALSSPRMPHQFGSPQK